MVAIERDNPRLKRILPRDFSLPALDKHRLRELIDVMGTIGLGNAENRSKNILGRVYEYNLPQFAIAEGKNDGQFYTSRCVVRVLVEMLAPYTGHLYDRCCGLACTFGQSEKFVEEHGEKRVATTSRCYTGTFAKSAGWSSRNSPRSTAPRATSRSAPSRTVDAESGF